MKKLVEKFTLIALMIALTALFSGCGKSETTVVNTAIIVGKHALAPNPEYTSLTGTLSSVCKSSGRITVISAEGEPRVVIDLQAPEIDKGISSSKKQKIIDSELDQIFAAIRAIVAETPEVDILNSLSLAARSLQDTSGEKHLYLLDPGLHTAEGTLNMATLFFHEDNDFDSLIEELREHEGLPDLSGIHVHLCGLGDTVAPQQPLTENHRRQLEAFYTTLLNESGAASITIKANLSQTPVSPDLPTVTPIILPEFNTSQDGYTQDSALVLDESYFAFLPDSTELTDPEGAQKILDRVADYYISHPEENLAIIGTTSSYGEAESLRIFSAKRGDTVRELLYAMGVPLEQMEVYGLGYGSDFTTCDRDAEDHLIEDIAASNRKVILTGNESSYAIAARNYLAEN